MSRTILTINQVVVKGYHECPFAVKIGERFIAQKERIAVNLVTSKHVHRELVAPLSLRNEIFV